MALTTFPLTWYSGSSFAPMPDDDPTDVLLNRIEQAFLAANTQPIWLDEPATPELVLAEWDKEYLAEGDDILADALAIAIEKTLDALPEQRQQSTTALAIVRNQLIGRNPWEIFDEFRAQTLSLPGTAEAFEMLFADALNHLRFEQCQSEINRMVQWLIVTARNGLEAYREIEKAYQAAVDEVRRKVALLKAEQKTAKAMPVGEGKEFGFWEDEIPADPDEFFAAPKALSPLQEAEAELRKLLANRPKHETGSRPVDLYRLYGKALRVTRKAGFLKAGSILRDLQLEASTPFADMDNPDYIDPYTKEIDPEAKEYRIRIPAVSQVLLTPERPAIPVIKLTSGITLVVRADDTPDYEQVAKDCNWTVEELEKHVAAQEGYAIEPSDEVEEWLGEFWQETRDPVWMQIQQDFVTSENYAALAQEARAYTGRCREFVNDTMRLVKSWLKVYLNPGDSKARNEQIVDILMGLGSWDDEKALRAYLKKLANREDWTLERKLDSVAIQTVKRTFLKTDAAIEFIAFLNELVRRGEKEVDIALIFLSLQNGLMFPEEAAQDVSLSHTVGDAVTLYDFIEDNEEEILANLNDRAPKRTDEPYELVAEVAEQGIRQAIATGDAKSNEIRKTPEYIEGYIRAAMTAKTVTFRDESGYHNALEEAGWSNFRMKRSPKGAELYSQARARKATQRQAMAAFWKQYGLEQRRKAESKIKGTWAENGQVGLTLSNGRKVSFNIAVMKFNSGEFEHTPEEWRKIASFLRAKKIGGYFCSLIDRKYQVA